MSLLEKIQRKEYPLIQILDRESLSFIRENLENYAQKHIKKSLSEIDKERFIKLESLFVEKYSVLLESIVEHINNREMEYSIHGTSHAKRVAFLCWLILQRFEKLHFLEREVVLAGIFHDLRRENDNADVGHGLRAGLYLGEMLTDSSNESMLGTNLDVVAKLCELHDENIELDESDAISTLVHIIKLADCLERIRQPKITWWPDFTKNKIQPSEAEIEMSIISFISDYYE